MEKKKSKLSSTSLIFIVLFGLPFVTLILGFILGLSPFLVLAYLIYQVNDTRLQKHKNKLRLEYKLKTTTWQTGLS